MSFDYSGLAATAVAQIADKGRSVSLVYKTGKTFDPDTNTMSGASDPTPQTVKMLIKNFNRREVDGSLIKVGDKIGLIANDALTRAPKTGDQITDDSETFTIKDVKEIKPGDTVLLYQLQLRK